MPVSADGTLPEGKGAVQWIEEEVAVGMTFQEDPVAEIAEAEEILPGEARAEEKAKGRKRARRDLVQNVPATLERAPRPRLLLIIRLRPHKHKRITTREFLEGIRPVKEW